MAEPWKEFGGAAEPEAGPWAEFKAPATIAPKLQPGTEEDSPGFLGAAARGFKRSLPETKSLLYGGAAALGGAVGADGVRDWGLENYERVQRDEVEPLASKSGFQSSLKGDTSLGEWAGDTIGNFGGQALQSLAAAGAGAAVGSVVPGAGNAAGAVGGLVAKGAVKKGVELAVKKMVANQVEKGIARDVAETGARKAVLQNLGGAAVAGTGLNIAQETGIAYTGRATDAAAAGEDLNQGDALRAIGWGVPAGLVDTAAEAIAAGRLARGVSGSSSLLKRVVGGAGLGAVTEGGTEAVQAAMERAGAGQEVTGEEAVSDYIENAAAGALGGSTIGGASGVRRARLQPGSDVEAPSVSAAPSIETPAVDESSIAPPPARAQRSDDSGFRAQLAEQIGAPQPLLRFPEAAPGSLSDAANVLEVNPAAGGLVDAADALQRAEFDAKAAKAKPAKQEKPEPKTPPANMDPETGETLSIDAQVWPGAAEHQQPARIIEALVAEAMKGGRPSGVTRISETYNIDMDTARALRKRAVADLAKPISAAPASPDGELSASVVDEPRAAADAELAALAARDPEQAVRSESEVLEGAGASASAPVVERAQDTPLEAEHAVYDESDEEQPEDIGSPSGGPFTIADAAQRVASRTEGGKVYEVAGGFVVRTPQAGKSAVADAPTPSARVESPAVQPAGTDAANSISTAEDIQAAPVGQEASSIRPAAETLDQPATALAVPEKPVPGTAAAPAARAELPASTAAQESAVLGESGEPAASISPSEIDATQVPSAAQPETPQTSSQAQVPQERPASDISQELPQSIPAQARSKSASSAQPTPLAKAEQAAPAAGVHAGPRVRVKQGKPVYDEQDPKTISAYFKPGDIVESYGGGTDRVVSFSPGTGKGDWSVRVVRVNKDGSAVPGEAERTHTTAPLRRELVTKFGKPQVPTKRPKEKPGSAIAAAASAAATSPTNDRPEPTEAQKEAGNYAKGHHRIGGLDISIENPAGTRRRPEWPPLKHHYGYFKGTVGFDKDHVDVFLTDHAEDQALPVFIVDQVNKDGSFDEHKVVLGAADEAVARAAYLANYGKGWTGLGAITQMSHDEFKAWISDPVKTKRPAGDLSAITPSVKVAKEPDKSPPPAAKIDDFGETLHGARKHYAAAYADRVREAESLDIALHPLSKTWPEPDYAKLLEGGADPRVVAFVHAARDEVPTKPQQRWKLARFIEQVQELRTASNKLLSGEIPASHLFAGLETTKLRALDEITGRMELYQEVGHERSLKGISVRKSHYSVFNGEHFNPAKVMWTVDQKAKASAYSNWPKILGEGTTKEEAIAAFKAKLSEMDKPADRGPTRFDIYSRRRMPGFYIGKKVGREMLDLQHFDDAKAAREFLANNQEKLEALLAAKKEIPAHRRTTNSPRVGTDHRGGADVSPEQFTEAFGFRGVQFGNYVEGPRRQADLNEAYDALMDMAGILNIPARALSLNGTLGLAFGARGQGGKNAAAAHFERGNVVINLTKGGGAGSIGHEWWHSLDNYFSRQRGRPTEYVTGGAGGNNAGLRAQMLASFEQVMRTIQNTGLRARSNELDKRRTKPYWSTDIEMSARSFESYLIAKLEDAGQGNDYLANVVSEAAFGMDDAYPYLSASEVPAVRAAFDSFFTTVETETTPEGNVRLFSKDSAGGGLTFDRALQLKQELTAKWGDNAPNVVLVEDADGLPDSAKASPDYRRAEGFFSGRQTVWLNVGMIRDEKRFAEVLAHEALGHFGVEQIVGEKEWRAISDTIARHDRDGTGADSLRKVMADVHRKQPGLAPDVFAREVIAFMAEKGIRSGLLDRVVAAVRRYLRKIMPALEWTHRDLVDLLGQADSFLLRGTSRIERQAAVRAYAFSRALATPLSDTFKALAKMDGAFRYAVSEKDTLGGVFADVDPSMTVTLKGTANTSFTREDGGNDLADKYEIQTADGAPAYVYVEQGGDRMYLDASSLTPGASGGTALYMGLFNYARNAGKVFIGDPAGLSDAALIRRTELMAAAALKYGGTDFMRPHPRQLAPGFRWAAPLQWGDDQAANLENLLGTAYNNVLNFARGDQSRGVLGIDDVRFDFGKNEFLGPGDKAVTRDQLEGIAARARKAFASRPGADDNGREASFGRASIARAVLAQSALRESQQGTQPDLVGSDLRIADGGRQGAAPGPLSGILYSKADLQVDGRGRRTMTLAGETFVERGNRYYLVNGTGEPKDFRTLGAAKEAAVATGGEILQDEAIEGVRPTWSVVAPASMAREAEVSRGLFSKAVPADILEDVEAVMRGGDQVGLLARVRAAIAEATPKKLKDQLRGTWLGALTTRHLTELGSDYFENIRHYSDFLAEMGADRNKLQAEGEDVAEGARKWAGKNRAQAKALFDLMHSSTIDGVDPSKEFKPLQFRYSGQLHDATEKNVKDARKALQQQMRERAGDSKKDMMLESKLLKSLPGRDRARRAKYPSLVERWNALPAEAQQIYRDFRDLYEKRSDQVEQGLVDRINDTDAPDNQKRKIINVIRQQFETARLQGVYFPLQRFGRYFVAATKDDSQTFLMFERLSDLERAVKNLRGRGFTITAQGKKQDGTAKDAPSGTFVADVIQQMKKSGVSEATQDQIYQIYLQALPELSMRKHNIHRQAVPGFDTDAVRAFAFSMHHGAHQLARLRFAHKMQDTLDLLRKQQDAARKEEASDTRKIAAGDAVLEELGKRHEWIMNPQDSQLTNLVSSFGFVYYLGLTPAAALVNLTQTAMVSYPYLASRFGGIKAMNHLLAGMRDSIRTAGHIQKTLTDPNEIRAHQVLQAMGALDKTQAHNLAGIAEGGLQGYNPAWSKAMEIIGWGFHKTEVVNREATGLAAYRLARADGQSFDEAVRFAAETINQTHFDYTNANRARFMQSGTAKTLLMFRQYSLNMTWHLARMVWKATKGESPEVKRIARRNLAGILGMSSLFSGVLGLPLVSVTMGALNAIASSFGDDDEPWDAETEFRAFLVDMLGKDAAETLLGGVANKVTGADVASRVSLSQLWFRDADRELDGRGAYYNLLEQAAGPMGGVLKNALVGKQLMDDGHLMRGFETMLPKSLKDMVKASRYATEGVNNLRGDPLVADPGVYRTLLQLGGFTPAKVADQYDRNRALKNYEKHILDRRQHLMDGFAMAMRLGDTEGRTEILAKIRTFNQTNPEIAISSASIKRSLASRARYSKQAEAGIVLNPRLAAKVRAAVGAE